MADEQMAGESEGNERVYRDWLQLFEDWLRG